MIWSRDGVIERDLKNDPRALCVRPLLQVCDFPRPFSHTVTYSKPVQCTTYVTCLLIYLLSNYTYTGMIIRYSTTIVLLICFRNVKHACIQKHHTFAKMIAVWTPQGMAYLRGAGRPQDPVLAAEWLGGVQFIFIEKMTRMRNMFQYVLMFSTWILTLLIQKFMHHLMFAACVCLRVEPMVEKYWSHSWFSKG